VSPALHKWGSVIVVAVQLLKSKKTNLEGQGGELQKGYPDGPFRKERFFLGASQSKRGE
jgi:hypothetical protein